MGADNNNDPPPPPSPEPEEETLNTEFLARVIATMDDDPATALNKLLQVGNQRPVVLGDWGTGKTTVIPAEGLSEAPDDSSLELGEGSGFGISAAVVKQQAADLRDGDILTVVHRNGETKMAAHMRQR